MSSYDHISMIVLKLDRWASPSVLSEHEIDRIRAGQRWESQQRKARRWGVSWPWAIRRQIRAVESAGQ